MTVGLWLLLAGIVLFITPLLATPFENPDTMKVLAIRVEFQPDNASTTTGDGTFDLSNSNDPFQIDPPPHNRSYFQDHLLFLNNYFKKVSRGALHIKGDVFPSAQNDNYRLDHPMTFYNPNTTPQEINQRLATLFRDAVQKADEDPEVVFSRYDAYIIFHAGVGRDIDFGLDETPQDIPSLFITKEFLQTHLGVDGILVDGDAGLVSEGSLLPETESQEGLQLGLNGILVSNFGSQLGWLDLFSPDTRRSGVGRFSLMDAGLFNGDGLVPALPDAWTRINAGWETPVTIYQAQDEEFEIYSLLSDDPRRVYKFPVNENEYFLLENRYAGEKSLESLQLLLFENRNELPSMREVLERYYPTEAVFSDSTGVLIDIDNPDRGLPGGLVIAQNDTTLPGGAEVAAEDTIWYGTGVLIWHIDENIIAQNRAENRINADPNHRGVDVEEADGSRDIGEEYQIISGAAGSEIGTVLDSWYADNPAPVFIQDPQNEFSVSSTPHSRSYYNRADSHIKFYGFSRLDTVMTFRANLNFFQADFPRRIDTGTYGKITTLKIADLDGNGAEELVMTTEQNKVLVMNREGQVGWGSDSLEVISLPVNTNILTPPAIFELADGNKAIVILTNDSQQGTAYGFTFNKATQGIDSLFQFPVSDNITTFPVAEYEGSSRIPLLFWGTSGGKVYQTRVTGTAAELSERLDIQETIEYLHILQISEEEFAVISVSESGNLFVNQAFNQELSTDFSQPVGTHPVLVSSDGTFLDLLDEQIQSPEAGIHRFDSPLLEIRNPAEIGGSLQHIYVVAGNNRVQIFNYNFTLLPNFPAKLYNPEQPTGLFLSPVVGFFPTRRGEDENAVIVVDPAGMITGFDFRGNLLPDFPLAVGDSLRVNPALLDIDGDEDLELACVTENGTVYAWDFASRIDENTRPQWPQIYATPENNNRQSEYNPSPPPDSDVLLPPESVYNWPNPNSENYTFIRYRLTEDAEVNIKIFDLAGDLVRILEGTGYGQTDNEVRWDLNGVQSGVYIGRVEARSAGRSEVRMIKIAVVK
jgi:M6 family metalloprotease-like protein